MTPPRRVLITTADTTHTFTLVGGSPTGTLLTEILGPITTSAYSTLDYATLSSVTPSGALTANASVGTNNIASTPWVRFDDYAPAPVAIQVDISGGTTVANATIQASLDDPNSATNPVLPSAMVWVSTSDLAGVNANASFQSNFAYAPAFARVLLNSGNATVTATFTQLGGVPY